MAGVIGVSSGGWRSAVGATGLAVLLSACSTPATSSDAPSSGAALTMPGTASRTPSPSAAGSSGSSGPASASASVSTTGSSGVPRTDLVDGRYPAYFTKVDATRRLVTIDVVQFFTGKAAATAAAGDNPGETSPPNDYYIRNANPRLRTLAVVEGAAVSVNVLSAAESGDATKDTVVTLAKLASYPSLKYSLFWVTVRDGVVTRLAEQFLP